MSAISIQNAAHFDWGKGCDGWHLYSGSDFSVIQERMPPHTSEVPHRHAKSRQFFYTLSGTLTILLDDVLHSLPPTYGLEIPPGANHRVFNDSDSDVQFLIVSVPPSKGDRIETE